MSKPEHTNTKIDFFGQAFKRYFFNTSWLFLERILRLGLNFVVSIYVIRYLGPEQNGMLAFAISVSLILLAFSTLGLRGIVVREKVKDESKTDVILGSAFTLKLFFSALLFIIVAIFYLNRPSLQNLLILFVAASIIFQAYNVAEFYFQAKVISKFTVYSKIPGILISDIAKIYFILSEASLIYFAAAYSIEFLIHIFGYIYFLNRNKVFIKKWNFGINVAKSLLKDSWPLMFSSVATIIYLKIDKVILMEMMDRSAVGIYDAATRICESLYFIPVAITTSIFPAIVKAKEKSELLYDNRLQKLYNLVGWIAIGLALPMSIFSNNIISFLYGDKFIEAGAVLAIYIWAGVPVFLYVANNQYLVTENLTKIYFYRSLIGMVVNIILNIILIPLYGINGSAFATLISYTITAFSIVFIHKTRRHTVMMMRSIFLLDLPKSIRSGYRDIIRHD